MFYFQLIVLYILEFLQFCNFALGVVCGKEVRQKDMMNQISIL